MTRSIVDPSFELIDPCPNIHALFIQFNNQFFGGALAMCEVKWSPRMYSCAGICSYEVRGGRGGLCSIRLSQPLLKLRPRKDLVETLLHEMIHAYLFVKERNRDRDGHGPQFQAHMNRINMESGTNITIYHSFHNEVALYKTHVWRCDGICKDRRPFFGYVKRSSNRAPGPNDLWWKQHQNSCGGKFIKIKEPEGFGQRKRKTKKTDKEENKPEVKKPAVTLDNFYVTINGKKNSTKAQSSASGGFVPFQGVGKKLGGEQNKINKKTQPVVPFSGKGIQLNGSNSNNSKPNSSSPEIIVLDDSDDEIIVEKPTSSNSKDEISVFDDDFEVSFVVGSTNNIDIVVCPSCNVSVLETLLHDHLDHCLG